MSSRGPTADWRSPTTAGSRGRSSPRLGAVASVTWYPHPQPPSCLPWPHAGREYRLRRHPLYSPRHSEGGGALSSLPACQTTASPARWTTDGPGRPPTRSCRELARRPGTRSWHEHEDHLHRELAERRERLQDAGLTWTARNTGLEGATILQVATWGRRPRTASCSPPPGPACTSLATPPGAGTVLPDERTGDRRGAAAVPRVALGGRRGGCPRAPRDLQGRGTAWDAPVTPFGDAEVVALALSPSFAQPTPRSSWRRPAPPAAGECELVVWRTTDRGSAGTAG